MSAVDLGLISFDAPDHWRFFPLDQGVVGRPMDLPGILNVIVVQGNNLPPCLTHDGCMSTARAAVQYELPVRGFDRARDQLGACVAGGESYFTTNDFVRIWYHQCATGLVVSWFGCPKKAMEEPAVQSLIRQCDLLIASVKLPEGGAASGHTSRKQPEH